MLLVQQQGLGQQEQSWGLRQTSFDGLELMGCVTVRREAALSVTPYEVAGFRLQVFVPTNMNDSSQQHSGTCTLLVFLL